MLTDVLAYDSHWLIFHNTIDNSGHWPASPGGRSNANN
jgi:hypothetical protein